jgi:hypothetical protein
MLINVDKYFKLGKIAADFRRFQEVSTSSLWENGLLISYSHSISMKSTLYRLIFAARWRREEAVV